MDNINNTETIRAELKILIDSYPATSMSEKIRSELCDIIVAIYSAGIISRDEYHNSLTYL